MLYYTATDQTMIAQADLFAATKHACQSRKDGSPYIHHPRYVSVLSGYWASTYFYGEKPADDEFSRLGIIRVAALCHDLMEDQGVDFATLHVMFGMQVAKFVKDLSIDYSLPSGEERNLAYCQQLRDTCIDVQLIKLADIYHNAVSVAPSVKFSQKWVKKADLMLDALNKIPRSCAYWVQTLGAVAVRKGCVDHGGIVSSEGMGSTNARCANKENGTSGDAQKESAAACD